MVKATILQGSATDFNNDQDHGCCGVFKNPFRKRNTAAQPIPPEPIARPAAPPTNQHKHVEPDVNPTPGIQEEPQVITTPEDSPVPTDGDPSQTSREEKANAKFRKAREQLEKVISKPNAASPIQLSFLDSSDIGNLSQMARDIEFAISEFLKERDKHTAGEATAKSWAHKVSFAGQKILGTAESVASVGSIVSDAEIRNSSHTRLAAWLLVRLDIF
jgi:hypothetical protein